MKKGFTIIETVISLSIMLAILTIAFLGRSSLKRYEEKLAIEHAASSIVGFINYGKSYSRSYKIPSYIILNGENNLMLVSNSKNIHEINMPHGINISKFNDKTINIKSKGYVSDACTIKIKSQSGFKKEISIMVGTNYVHVKE